MPFSEFVRRVRANDVSSVSVDGLDIHFSLKPDSSLLKDPPAGAEGARVSARGGELSRHLRSGQGVAWQRPPQQQLLQKISSKPGAAAGNGMWRQTVAAAAAAAASHGVCVALWTLIWLAFWSSGHQPVVQSRAATTSVR